MSRALRAEIEAEARRRLYNREAQTWRAALDAADAAFRCGARTKSRGGQPCQARPLPGQKRCRLHGGVLPVVTDAIRALRREKAQKQPRGPRGRWATKSHSLRGETMLALTEADLAES